MMIHSVETMFKLYKKMRDGVCSELEELMRMHNSGDYAMHNLSVCDKEIMKYKDSHDDT